MTRHNRIMGALFGFIAGDALGASVEFMNPDEIQQRHGVLRDIVGGGWLQLEPGQVTDDTEMMLAVAASMMYVQGYDARDMADRMVRWYEDDPVDVGSTVRSGLHRYVVTGELSRPVNEEHAGNGALMRVLPFGLVPGAAVWAFDHAHLTHNSSVSDTAIAAYLCAVKRALDGQRPELCVPTYPPVCTGHVGDTMRTVQWAFGTTGSFEDALVACVNRGGDADTAGAILGGLAGAYYGYGAIPKRWTDVLDPAIVGQADAFARWVQKRGTGDEGDG